MDPSNIPRPEYAGATGSLTNTSGQSAASWPAIFAGAFVAAATSLILITLGAGLGFASISPWPGHGASVTTFAVTTAIWLVVTQWFAAAVGGYIAGRLRTRWVGTHTHEVFFRDTAHGFVTWSVATVLVAALFAAAAVSGIGAGAHAAGGAVTAGAGFAAGAGGPGNAGPMADPHGPGYDVDRLFRPSVPGGSNSGAAPAIASAGGGGGGGMGGMGGDPRMETAHITANALATGNVPDDDRQFLAGLVAARTGVSQADAEKRVDDYIAKVTDAANKAKAAADAARKAAAQAALYTALSMLIGAFIASVSAALGGRLRDEHL